MPRGAQNTIDSDSKQVASVLARADAAVDATALGDPFLLGEEFRGVSATKVTNQFGEGFAKRIFAMETGRWQGPVVFGLRTAFRLYQRTSSGRPAAAR